MGEIPNLYQGCATCWNTSLPHEAQAGLRTHNLEICISFVPSWCSAYPEVYAKPFSICSFLKVSYHDSVDNSLSEGHDAP